MKVFRIKTTVLLVLFFLFTACGYKTSYMVEGSEGGAAIDTSTSTITYNKAESTTENIPIPTEKPSVPYIGMSESDIQNTKLGVAALTYDSGGFWAGESHTFHHYTFYYRYNTYTVIVFTVRTLNGVVDQVEDYRSSPIRVSTERHKTMIAAGVPVNYVGR